MCWEESYQCNRRIKVGTNIQVFIWNLGTFIIIIIIIIMI